MKTERKYTDYAEELRSRMLLETFPIAIAMLESEADIPEGAVRPVRDLGGHMSLCQGFALSRREELTVAFLKEDHWCYVPVVAFGQAEPPQFILDGNADYPERVTSIEAAKRIAGSVSTSITGNMRASSRPPCGPRPLNRTAS